MRAVTAGAADLPTWRAIGADRRSPFSRWCCPPRSRRSSAPLTARRRRDRALVAVPDRRRPPLRPRPGRRTPTGWCSGSALVGLDRVGDRRSPSLSAEWRVSRGDCDTASPSTVGELGDPAGLPPSLLIGSRLAVETGPGPPGRPGAVGARRRHRRRPRRRRVLHVPRRGRRRGGEPAAIGHRLGLRRRRRGPDPGRRPDDDRATTRTSAARSTPCRARAVPINGGPDADVRHERRQGHDVVRRARRAVPRRTPTRSRSRRHDARPEGAHRRRGRGRARAGHGRLRVVGTASGPRLEPHRLRPERVDDPATGCAPRSRRRMTSTAARTTS